MTEMNSRFSLEGERALITGGGTGIGASPTISGRSMGSFSGAASAGAAGASPRASGRWRSVSALAGAGSSAGFVTAAVFGYLAIALVRTLMKRNGFRWFSVYCLAVGLVTVILSLAL